MVYSRADIHIIDENEKWSNSDQPENINFPSWWFSRMHSQ